MRERPRRRVPTPEQLEAERIVRERALRTLSVLRSAPPTPLELTPGEVSALAQLTSPSPGAAPVLSAAELVELFLASVLLDPARSAALSEALVVEEEDVEGFSLALARLVRLPSFDGDAAAALLLNSSAHPLSLPVGTLTPAQEAARHVLSRSNFATGGVTAAAISYVVDVLASEPPAVAEAYGVLVAERVLWPTERFYSRAELLDSPGTLAALDEVLEVARALTVRTG